MATFAARTSSGEAVHVALAPRRGRIHLDRSALRLIRARTFAACQAMGLSVADIADAYNFNGSTVYADLAWLRDRKAAGLDRLPHERRDADDDAA